MPTVMQAKLLRVLEEGEIERVGGSGAVRVDARVLVATHRNLEDLVKNGTFRQDLYHRVFVFPVTLPPLRERMGDVPVLIQHFTRQISQSNNWKPKEFTPGAVRMLERYSWPGNIRELRNAVERLLLLAGDSVDEGLVADILPNTRSAAPISKASDGPLSARVDAFERAAIEAEIANARYNMTEAAKALGLERSHLYKKCAQLGIDIGSRSSGTV
jgi:DNA-binding NtrC family response regulator